MTPKITRRDLSLGLLAAGTAGTFLVPGSRAHAASADLVAAAEAEGTVVWYTTMIVDQAVRPIVAAFEAKYPKIKVEFSRAGSGDTALKIINEAQAGRPMGDIFDGTATFSNVMPAGAVEAYIPESAADYSGTFKDPDGYWHALNFYFLTTVYNTDMVTAEEAPKTFDDLLAAEWKDQMVWSIVPEPTAAPGFVGNMLMTKGEEAGMAYLDKLAAQNVVNVDASQRVVIDRVIAGEFPLGLMCFNHHVAISAEKGAPVEWVKMEPIVSAASLLGKIKDGPNPNAGKLLIDYILSKEGQEVLASTSYIPTHPNVAPTVPTLSPAGPEPFEVNFMSPKVVEDNLTNWIDILKQKFL
jgi:ABC-type Fe3+ transport system substrate-binding protein